jgi:enhancer of mRNA-decapping protein 4
MIQKGQLNSAFQMALCAADLNLLMNVCELVNPNQVFEQTLNSVTKKSQCQLQQPVILSLIQQLSQELNSHTDLKLKYLEEAIVNLDLNNPLTREHTPAVMGQLISKLQLYIQSHPNDKMVKNMKMLLMASQSLTNQPKQQISQTIKPINKVNLMQNDHY